VSALRCTMFPHSRTLLHSWLSHGATFVLSFHSFVFFLSLLFATAVPSLWNGLWDTALLWTT